MSLNLDRIRAVCLDVDGTLRDTDDQFVLRLTSWLQPLSFLFPHRNPRHFARRLVMATETPGSYVFGLPDRLGLDHSLAALGDWIYRRGIGRKNHSYMIIPGVKEVLDQLYKRFPLSVISARGERNTLAFLQAHDLLPYFRVIVTGQTCKHTKPFPDPIRYAASQMEVPPQACLMVGDTVVDIRSARAAGAQSVGVLCGFGEEHELQRAGANLILPSTTHLPQALRAHQ